MLTVIPPDLSALLEPMPCVEDACKRLLNYVQPAFHARETCDLPNTRIDISFALGAWHDRWLPDGNGVLRHSAWLYTLTLGVYTVREPGVPDIHATIRRRIRQAMQRAILDPAFLPWHCLASFNEKSGTESIETKEDSDVSALVYDGIITVRSDAMAAVTS